MSFFSLHNNRTWKGFSMTVSLCSKNRLDMNSIFFKHDCIHTSGTDLSSFASCAAWHLSQRVLRKCSKRRGDNWSRLDRLERTREKSIVKFKPSRVWKYLETYTKCMWIYNLLWLHAAGIWDKVRTCRCDWYATSFIVWCENKYIISAVRVRFALLKEKTCMCSPRTKNLSTWGHLTLPCRFIKPNPQKINH